MIREMTEDDVVDVIVVGSRMFAESQFARFTNYDPDRIAGVLMECVNNKDCYAFVADVEGKIVGFIFGIATPHFLCGHMQSHEFALYVLPEHRKTGSGVQLIKRYIEWAKEHHVQECLLDSTTLRTQEERDAVGRLFERRGFKSVGNIYGMDLGN